MSTVDDVRNGWGDWDLTWRRDAPLSVISAADPERFPFALVRIYAAQVDPGQIGTAPCLFTGLLMRANGTESIGGYGPTWLAGTPGGSVWATGRDGSGPFTTTTITHDGSATGTLTDWLGDILTGSLSGLGIGYVGGPSFKKSGTVTAHTVRTVLDSYFRVRFGVEWRITPELKVDIGYRAQLYPTTTVPLAASAGRDPETMSLLATELGLENDWSDWISGAVVRRSNGVFYSSAGSATAVNPGSGAALNWRAIAESTGDANEASDQATELFNDSGRTRSARISATEYDLTSRVPVGSYLDVWDPTAGFYDPTAAKRYYRGNEIQPVRLRVEGVKWPIQEGMSVWLDRRQTTGNADDLIDLTPHVEWAAPDTDTTITVGALPPRLGRRR